MHNIQFGSYSEKVNRKAVQSEWDEYVRMEDWQEGASGLPNPIRWLEGRIYNSRDEAEEAIKRLDNGWYDQIAVKYYHPVEQKSQKLEELNKVCVEAMNEYRNRDRELYASKVTSAYIGCKNCGSKISRVHLHSNCCPVCRAELRPEHMIKRVEAARNKWERAVKQKEDWINKHSKKEVRWLVKIEYHT